VNVFVIEPIRYCVPVVGRPPPAIPADPRLPRQKESAVPDDPDYESRQAPLSLFLVEADLEFPDQVLSEPCGLWITPVGGEFHRQRHPYPPLDYQSDGP